MKNLTLALFLLSLSLGTFAQSFAYDYDNAGNRVHRYLVELKNAQSNPNDTIAPVIEQMGEMKITVYPNPTAGQLRIEITNLPEGETGSLHVWDLQGKEFITLTTLGAGNLVDLSAQPKGNYLMRIEIAGKKSEWKIVKQ